MTFGTGGMLDVCLGDEPPAFARKGPSGTFPIVAWRRGGRVTWGLEAFMLTAGQAVEWVRDDLGLISSSAESEEVAGRCRDTGDVWFVPSLLGMGTPAWDFGARGTLLGLTRGTGRPEVVRAVLEGIAHRGADLLEAAEADSGFSLPTIRVDGGMSANKVFVQALADATQRPVEVSPVARGHHPGRRLPRRPGHRHVVRRGRRGRHLESRRGRRTGPEVPPRTLAAGPRARPRLDPRAQRPRLRLTCRLFADLM